MRAILIAIAIACASGCGARTQRQVTADTRAAAQAAATMPDGPARAALYEAIGRSVLALTDNLPGLPSPTWSPAEIAADPEEFIEATSESAAKPPAYEAPPNTGPPRPGPADILREIGEQALRWGTWAALAGIVALLLRFVPWWGIGAVFSWGPLATLAGLSASLGSFATITGSAAMWLADYLWIVVLAVVVSGVGVAIFHLPRFKPLRDRLTAAPRRLWDKAVSPFSKV